MANYSGDWSKSNSPMIRCSSNPGLLQDHKAWALFPPFTCLWLAGNEGNDPYSRPYITCYSSFDFLFDSFLLKGNFSKV